MRFKILAPLLLVIALASSAQAAVTCAQVFSPSFAGAPSQKAVLELQELLTSDLRQQSDLLVRQTIAQGGKIHVNKLVIGAGLHGSIFATNAGRNNHRDDILVIDGGDVISKVFGEMAGTFNINSAELPQQSSNIFPGSALEMKDLISPQNPKILKGDGLFYADSGKMATLATSTMYGSGVRVLFGNKAIEIISLAGKTKSNEQYLVKTSMGFEIYVREIVFSTGLGEPSVPMKDLNTRSLVENYFSASDRQPRQLFPVMSVDSFLRWVQNSEGLSESEVAKGLQGKTIAVVGKGDGGKIVIERLVKIPRVHIKWLGQEAKNPDDYRASTWSRYFTISENIGREVETLPGHVQKVVALPNGKIKIISEDGAETFADITLLATGYKTVLPGLLSHLVRDGASHDVTLEPLTEQNQVIGGRVLIDGKATEGLYVAGPAAGHLASHEQMAASTTKNPVSVNVMGQFSQALANHLFPSSGKTILNAGKELTVGTYKPSPTGRKIPGDARVLPLLTKLELQRSLSKFAAEATDLKIHISKEGQQLAIKISDLDSNSASQVLKALAANDRLLEVLQGLVSLESSLQIQIPVKGKSLIFENMTLEVR